MILDAFCIHDPSLADGRYDSSESFTGDREVCGDDFALYLIVQGDTVRVFSKQADAESALVDGDTLVRIQGWEYAVQVYGDGCYYQTIIESQEVLIGECPIDFTGESDWAFYYD